MQLQIALLPWGRNRECVGHCLQSTRNTLSRFDRNSEMLDAKADGKLADAIDRDDGQVET